MLVCVRVKGFRDGILLLWAMVCNLYMVVLIDTSNGDILYIENDAVANATKHKKEITMVTVFNRVITLYDKTCKYTKYKATLKYLTKDSEGGTIFRDVTRHGGTKQEALCSAYESLMRRESGRL